MPSELERLRRQNEVLQEHVRRLLKAEQSLYISQRALERQLKRLDVLNRFSAEAARLTDAAQVLRRAAVAFCEVFPADQCAGFLLDGKSATLTMSHAAAGYEARPQLMGYRVPQDVEPPQRPLVATEQQPSSFFPGAAALLEAAAGLFGGPAIGEGGRVGVLPIGTAESRIRALLVVRMLRDEVSYHEERPSPFDLPFFELLTRQVSAALDNTALVASLSESYRKLAQAQQELVKRERLAALGELSAVVAHEVRNPLAAMVNAVATMKRQAGLDGEQHKMLLGVLSEESARLDQIVNDMLDFARPHTPSLREERVAELVREAAQAALRSLNGNDARLRFTTDDEALVAKVDARMVRQAVMNLVLNAVQASAPGAAVSVALAAEKNMARIDITDCGSGIADGDLDRVFQPFFTTRATGTGLGLALVKRFIEAHQGEVRVASELGKGSTFSLLLPLR